MTITNQLRGLNDELERRTLPGLREIRDLGNELETSRPRAGGLLARLGFGGVRTTNEGVVRPGSVGSTSVGGPSPAEVRERLLREDERRRAQFELDVLQNQGPTRLITRGQQERAFDQRDRIAELLGIIAGNTAGAGRGSGGLG